jgi:hypothetical protein
MTRLSCENCSQSGILLEEIQLTVPTIFGTVELEMTVCNACKSFLHYCQLQYYELNDELSRKLLSRANQLRNSLKRNLK